MKSRLILAALGATWVMTLSARPVTADESWVINSFHSTIVINDDATISVTENVQVDFGTLSKHGIFRTIPIRYRYDDAHDRYYILDVKSVTNGSTPIPFSAYVAGVDEVIKIGDPNKLVSGPNTYVIAYTVQGVLNSFEDHDELYWNVDGALWPVPKQVVSATVEFPVDGFAGAACYQGPARSTEPCEYGNTNQSVTFTSTRRLGSGEQMTTVTGLHKGVVSVPPPLLEGRLRQFPQDAFEVTPLNVGVGLVVLLAGLGLIFRYWWLHGRDREYLAQYYLTNDPHDRPEPPFEHVPVVVEFDPPQNLRPAQLGLILDESADTKDVTATIVDLAVRGFLTIGEVQGRHDWVLSRKQDDESGLLPYERTLLEGLFANGRDQVKVSELKGTFVVPLRTAERDIYADAMDRKFFQVRPDLARAATILVAVILGLIGAGLTYALGMAFGAGLIGTAVILVALILLAVHRDMASRTAVGRDLMQKTLGFRLYMTTAEKYRQQFAEKAEIFTQLLPYAIVFGCVTRWAKAFDGIDTSATNNWYSGHTPFQAALLSSSLESMNSSLGAAISSTPASGGSGSGFGGGGFAGGGGGGGGGGSW